MLLLIGLILFVVPILLSSRGIGARRAYLIAAALCIAGAAFRAVTYSVDRPVRGLTDSFVLSADGLLLTLGVGLVVAGIVALKICQFCAGRTRRPALVCSSCGRGFITTGGDN